MKYTPLLTHFRLAAGRAPPGYLATLRTGRVTDFLATRNVYFYARADIDPGQPATPGCRTSQEPQQGHGTKTPIVVCAADLVPQLPLADGTAYRVWRYWPSLNAGPRQPGSAR